MLNNWLKSVNKRDLKIEYLHELNLVEKFNLNTFQFWYKSMKTFTLKGMVSDEVNEMEGKCRN